MTDPEQPFTSIAAGGAGLQDLAQLHKESLDARIGLGRIPTVDTETVALLVAQGIQSPRYFHQVG